MIHFLSFLFICTFPQKVNLGIIINYSSFFFVVYVDIKACSEEHDSANEHNEIPFMWTIFQLSNKKFYVKCLVWLIIYSSFLKTTILMTHFIDD